MKNNLPQPRFLSFPKDIPGNWGGTDLRTVDRLLEEKPLEEISAKEAGQKAFDDASSLYLDQIKQRIKFVIIAIRKDTRIEIHFLLFADAIEHKTVPEKLRYNPHFMPQQELDAEDLIARFNALKEGNPEPREEVLWLLAAGFIWIGEDQTIRANYESISCIQRYGTDRPSRNCWNPGSDRSWGNEYPNQNFETFCNLFEADLDQAEHERLETFKRFIEQRMQEAIPQGTE